MIYIDLPGRPTPVEIDSVDEAARQLIDAYGPRWGTAAHFRADTTTENEQMFAALEAASATAGGSGSTLTRQLLLLSEAVVEARRYALELASDPSPAREQRTGEINGRVLRIVLEFIRPNDNYDDDKQTAFQDLVCDLAHAIARDAKDSDPAAPGDERDGDRELRVLIDTVTRGLAAFLREHTQAFAGEHIDAISQSFAEQFARRLGDAMLDNTDIAQPA